MPRAAAALVPVMPSPGEMVSNVLLFVPCGAIVYSRLRGSATPWRAAAVTCAAGAAISLAVETLQLFLPRRDATVADVVPNTLGTLAGIALHMALRGQGRGLRRLPRRSVTVPIALGAYSAAALLVSAAAQGQTHVRDWDDGFPLLAGNERTGQRAWRGRVFDIELTDSATTGAVVERFVRGDAVPLAGRPIARFDFVGHAPFRDVIGVLPALAWTGPREEGRGDGVALPGDPWLQTTRDAAPIAQRVRETNGFSLRVDCLSDDVSQQGPARILSNSLGVDARNLTIAQDRDNLVVRIRTPYTGRNGSRPAIVVPGVFTAGERREVLVSYDGATVLVAVRGLGDVHRVPFAPGPMLLQQLTSMEIEGREYARVEWFYVAALAVVAALIVCSLIGSQRARVLILSAWLVVFMVSFEASLSAASGRRFGWRTPLASVVVGAIVMIPFVFAGRAPQFS